MSTWNYRLVKVKSSNKRFPVSYAVHEIHYNTAGQPYAMTKEPVTLDGFESPEDAFTAITLIQNVVGHGTSGIFKVPKKWADPDWEKPKSKKVKEKQKHEKRR